jgi:hypothetical protein
VKLGLPYYSAEWPHGLRCTYCDHLFRDGERYAVALYACAADGYPLTTASCINCLLDNQSERRGHDV